jgi:hypothetical protein
MKKIVPVLLILFISLAHKSKGNTSITDSIPKQVLGNFIDDYGIRYTVTDTLWTQHSGINYHIIKWNIANQYIIARNDKANPSEAGLYTRIDYMSFQNMAPFHWGFCLTVYNAATETEAEIKAQADRQNPKKGCGVTLFQE